MSPLFLILIASLLILQTGVKLTNQQRQQQQPYSNVKNLAIRHNPQEIKSLSFRSPKDGSVYRVTSYNATSSQESSIRIFIRKNGITTRVPAIENQVQELKFKSKLVDFDLDCEELFCHLVAVTGKSKRNVELYTWKRFQFDLIEVKDSFAFPRSVKLFHIRPNEFYIAIAQDQLHIFPSRTNLYDEDEQIRFIGCAIIKVNKLVPKPPNSSEYKIKYHQFIKLRFNPDHVFHYTSTNQNNFTTHAQAYENHYLVFSQDNNWLGPNANVTFIWSPLNDYFWPYRLPRGIAIVPPESKLPPGPYQYPSIKFPGPPVIDNGQVQNNQTRPAQVFSDWNQPIEACFSQLQRLLSERDLHSRNLVQSSQSLWRNPRSNENGLTSISARVIVYGDVFVKGSLVDSPQIALFSNAMNTAAPVLGQDLAPVYRLIDSHSPIIVDNKIKHALRKLNFIRDKLSSAVNLAIIRHGSDTVFNSKIKFLGNLRTRSAVFETNGIANGDVKLNGIQFNELKNELIGLTGAQEITNRVLFRGKVVADVLEIHGLINNQYYLRDALDINNNQVQIIRLPNPSYTGSMSTGMQFKSVSCQELVFAPNATINSIRLDEFITRDNRTQFIHGPKTFKNLAMANLNLNTPNTLLNGFNITNIGINSIRLRMAHDYTQVVRANHMTFRRPIKVGRLFVNNLINRYINLSSIIHDSVKSNDANIQFISGHKHFINGFRIDQLVTDGDINRVHISQVFNLNAAPPVSDYYRYNNSIGNNLNGNFDFLNINVTGNMNVGLLNNVDISKRAVRRFLDNDPKIQIVNGRKIFMKRLTVVNRIQLMNNSISYGDRYPTVNGFDLKSISAGIRRQIENPPQIYVENLEVEGNLNLPISNISANGQILKQARATIGQFGQQCPLDIIKNKLIVGGHLNQVIDTPLRVGTLRAKSVQLLNPRALNGIDFQGDFVLRSNLGNYANNFIPEPIFGHKYIENLRIAPSIQWSPNMLNSNNVLLGSRSTINDITYDELQLFINQERLRNSTGETVVQVMNVYGNIFAKRINGQYWPEDVLLKSIAANPNPSPHPYLHKRIYSNLIFAEPSLLEVEDQLVLRGPIQLNGFLNGVNLTEFSRSSVTYGDKDLLSSGRPIRNKVFLGGISVRGQFRSQGLIDGVNIDQMRDQVLTISPNIYRRKTQVKAPKVFMSDVNFLGPLNTIYLNDMIIDNYLKRVRVVYHSPNSTGGATLLINDKKTITGALKINRYLAVQGLINGIDFVDFEAKAISLSRPDDIRFNETLTIDGDVFMDNLIIDEKSGILDGVKLVNLIPLPINGAIPSQGYNNSGFKTNEIVVIDPRVDTKNLINGGQNLEISGSLNDCQISCSFAQPVQQYVGPNRPTPPVVNYDYSVTRPNVPPASVPIRYPSVIPQQASPMIYQPYKKRYIIDYEPTNMTYITKPPYKYSVNNFTYSPVIVQLEQLQQQQQQQQRPQLTLVPIVTSTSPVSFTQPPPIFKPEPQTMARSLTMLEHRKPMAVQYEFPRVNPAQLYRPGSIDTSLRNHYIRNEIELLRSQIVSLNFIKRQPDFKTNNLVVGFIQSLSNDITNYHLSEQDPPHSGHSIDMRHFQQLDQIDFPFLPTIYHLAVGVTPSLGEARNVTSVFSSIGGEESRPVSILPIESPNNAMFLRVNHEKVLFLLVSQDYTIQSKNYGAQCPRYWTNSESYWSNSVDIYNHQLTTNYPNEAGVHIYLFQPLHNSSALAKASFDMYQTIDLPAVDMFEKFTYEDSSYVLAISRLQGKIHLLLVRGYSGFQEVSYIDAPGVENVRVMYTNDKRPILVIYQTNGLHRVMESVII